VRIWNLHAIDTPEGIRSPVVLDSEDSRAVLIGIAPGQELGDHQVRERAWVVVVDGAVEVETGDGATPAEAGTLLEFDPAERRAVRSANGARVLILFAPWPGPGHYPDRTVAEAHS
jgi:quercetin dioxygenase-like cupin family protein